VSLYTPETRVPFLMRIPGLPGRRLTTPIGHTDLFATIINLAGGKPNSEMTGRSLVDAITGEGRDRVVLQQFSRPGAKQLRGAASRDCHVIYNAFPDTSWEVYRIDRDPLELDDLSETTECATTRRALEAWCNEHE
jgi:arylsulfatase A-like enzyme